MGVVEADYGIIYGRILENVKIPAPINAYFKTIVVPGFSDTHAHPQVVDGGLPGGPWRDSYHWIETRRLRVDEARVRADRSLASRLAAATMKRALLEGVTLIALTGRLEANVEAYSRLDARPRVVFLPTVMNRRGWPSLAEVAVVRRRVEKYLSDGMARVGVFVHSVRLTDKSTLRKALESAATSGSIVGIHLGEGVPEAHLLSAAIGSRRVPGRVVAVHCIDDDPTVYGLRCSSCPATNLILYRRTRRELRGVTSFGSDWPLLIGSVPRHLGLITSLWPRSLGAILAKATVGGYRDYSMPYAGDMAAYDAPLARVIEGSALPKLVTVAGKPVVVEGRLAGSGEDYSRVLREIRLLVREAIELYPAGRARGDPLEEAVRAFKESLLTLKKGGVARAGGALGYSPYQA